jgi:hypothetical protein
MVLWDTTPYWSVEEGSIKVLVNVANNQQTRRYIPKPIMVIGNVVQTTNYRQRLRFSSFHVREIK